jgi:hypothetical protein
MGPAMMDPADARQILASATDSLRAVHSLRDFTIAVKTGSEVAATMLDDVEKALLRILQTVNEDAGEV